LISSSLLAGLPCSSFFSAATWNWQYSMTCKVWSVQVQPLSVLQVRGCRQARSGLIAGSSGVQRKTSGRHEETCRSCRKSCLTFARILELTLGTGITSSLPISASNQDETRVAMRGSSRADGQCRIAPGRRVGQGAE
jgi:hypothetical protein